MAGRTIAASRPPAEPRPRPLPEVVGPRLARLRADVAGASPEARAMVLRDFWEEVSVTGVPLVEDLTDHADDRAVTFLWRDRADDREGTRSVLLLANKLTDFNTLEHSLLTRIADTDVWFKTYRLRADWRGSYHLAPDDPGARVGKPSTSDKGSISDGEYLRRLTRHAMTDPLNPCTTPHRWGGPELSVAELPHAPEQPWHLRRPDVPRGELTRHTVRDTSLGGGRTVWVYTPAEGVPEDGSYGLLVLFDGDMWGSRLPIAPTLDNLIAHGRVPPLVAVLVDSVDVRTRGRDLACHLPFVAFLTEELLPWLVDRRPITDDPGRTIVAGQSLGGLTAAFAARTAPERFGNVISQSGSFWWPNAATAEGGTASEWLTEEFAAAARLPIRFRIEVGLQEWALLGPTRRLRDTLRAGGYPVDYVEYNGGHDFVCWRGGLADGLISSTEDRERRRRP